MGYVINSYLDVLDSAATSNDQFIALNSNDSGNNSGWTIIPAEPNRIFVSYLDIQDSQASPSGIFYASYSVNSGNTVNWFISADDPVVFVTGFELTTSLGNFTLATNNNVIPVGVQATAILNSVLVWEQVDDIQTPNWNNIPT